jgi:hypothetical protein
MLFEDPDDDDREPAEPLSEEDYAYEQALMGAWNMANHKQEAAPAQPSEPSEPTQAPDES